MVINMNRVTLNNGKCVGYYYKEDLDNRLPEEDYAVLSIPSNESKYISGLLNDHFLFADRTLGMEMIMSNWEMNLNPGKKLSFVVSDDWDPEEIFSIAKGRFNNDCRFAVSSDMQDEEVKNELLHLFIIAMKEKRSMSTRCYKEGKITGFNLWSLEESVGRIFLGGVSDEYEGTGTGIYLYAQTIQSMKDNAVKIFLDYVSTSNLPSINLHIMLSHRGGVKLKIREGTDWYKKR